MTGPLTRGPRLCRLAAEKGLAPALDDLVAGRMQSEDGDIPYGPGGHAVVPLGVLTDRQRSACLDIVAVERPDEGKYQVAMLRRSSGERLGEEPPWWRSAVAWLRLGLSHRLRAQAVERLRERHSGEQRLVARQMVQDTLADALAEQLEAEALLLGEPTLDDGRPAVQASLGISTADRLLLHLMGASGFEANGVGAVTWISELIADAYLPDPVEDEGSDGA
ncbi:hypothetical protein [Actinomadura sp. SCN-SB]|uniref:hypothetical protein n=1 Tax=Actinomadura sp. SCN-SB TaxID=3373092 RepID=UPI003752B116